MNYSEYSVEELQGYFSDFHKDFYGHRPRFGSEEQWNDRAWLTWNIDLIHDLMDGMKKTFAGREELRMRHWIVEETDPELAKRAAWLKQERDQEYEAWVAEIDAKCA